MRKIIFIISLVTILCWACESNPVPNYKTDQPRTNEFSAADSLLTPTDLDIAVDEELLFDSSIFTFTNGFLELDWQILSNVQFEKKYYEEIGDFLLFPHFSPVVNLLDGKLVIITGYHIPIEETGTTQLVILSANPYTSCFFCGNAGPESVMEIRLQKPLGRMKMDELVTFRGTLKLNDTDIKSLNYILEDAEKVD